MKQAKQNLLFVEIQEPQGTRKDVLLATKDVLDTLKSYEEYRVIKEEKLKVVNALKAVMDNLQSLNRRLRAKLPNIPLTPASQAREKEEHITGIASMTRPASKLDSLKEELSRIEERLKALE
jgi:hypothetical protein